MRIKYIVLLFIIFLNLSGHAQTLVPLMVDKELKIAFEKSMIPQIENKYYWKEKIIAFYEVKNHPYLKSFVNLAVKSQAGDIYYFAWINSFTAPQLVEAKISKRISEGIKLKKQKEEEDLYLRKITAKKNAANELDSLNLVFRKNIDSIMFNSMIYYYEQLIKDAKEIEENAGNKFYFKMDALFAIESAYALLLDSLTESYRDHLMSGYSIEMKRGFIMDYYNATQAINEPALFENSSCLECETEKIIYSFTTAYNDLIENIPVQCEKNYLESKSIIEKSVIEKIDKKNNITQSIENDIKIKEDKIYEVLSSLSVQKLKKKSKIEFFELLYANFPAMNNDIAIIKDKIDEGEKSITNDPYSNTFFRSNIDDKQYQNIIDLYKLFLFVEKYLNEHTKK